MDYTLFDLLEDDGKCKHEYEDESLASNIYHCSLSTSLREIDRIMKTLDLTIDLTNEEDLKENNADSRQVKDFKEKVINNDWLFKLKPSFKDFPAINFDRIPSLSSVDNSQSADMLLIDTAEPRCYLIEFKNCSKTTLVEKYILSDSKAYIGKKFANSKNLLKSLSVEKLNDVDIIRNTEVIVVYNKNDFVETMERNDPPKKITEKDENGKQRSATREKKNKNGSACEHDFSMDFGKRRSKSMKSLKCNKDSTYDDRKAITKKQAKDGIVKFSKYILNLGFAKNQHLSNKNEVAVLAAGDFINYAEKGSFYSLNWGQYDVFF